MKQHLAAPSDLVDVRGIAELNGISAGDGSVTIGAATRHADVAANADVKAHIPALAALAGGIGDPAVRAMGTIGGSLANNDPAADYPAAVLGLGATIVTSKREIAADDYFEGMFATALEEDEIITAVRFPVPKRAGYSKFRNPASLYAMAGVFVAETGAACASQSPARARMASSATMGWRRRCPPTSRPGRSTVFRCPKTACSATSTARRPTGRTS
jgi:carbon-monoxide dehydrogenase medium subunit